MARVESSAAYQHVRTLLHAGALGDLTDDEILRLPAKFLTAVCSATAYCWKCVRTILGRQRRQLRHRRRCLGGGDSPQCIISYRLAAFISCWHEKC